MLLFVLLTGAAPPFERLLGQGGWVGLSVDAQQQRVTACLCAVLDAHQASSPIPRSAQVCSFPTPLSVITAHLYVLFHCHSLSTS